MAEDARRNMNEYRALARASEEKSKAHSKINILIRNTYRPEAFKKCISSILSQTNQNFKVIMCYDDERCLEYLEEYRDDNRIEMFKAGNVDKSESAFYNLYCNELLERVTEGWIMFLDDDDTFASKEALDMIFDQQFGTNSLIFWKFCRPDMLVYPDIDELTQDTIASSGYCFHSNHKHLSKWKTGERGDYAFIEGLIKSRHFNRYFIDSVLTRTTRSEVTKRSPVPYKQIIVNSKDSHRDMCNRLLSLIRLIEIPDFNSMTSYETVLIEFREFSHLEFLLRNTIIKLPSWSHTVVCGNKNENFMRKICSQICKDTKSTINIVKLDIDNLTPSDYSSLLATKHFGNNFYGEKILLYQEDTMLFHNNIYPFLEYDYVGAPWPPNQDDNS